MRTRPALTEAVWQRQVLDLARLLRWRVAHFRPARTADGGWRTPVAADGAGFPDLVLVRDRTVFVELKVEHGRLSEPQSEWLAALALADAEAYVWKPSDWPSVQAVLQRGLAPAVSA